MEIKWHDAKKDPPKKSKEYIVIKPGGVQQLMYDAERNMFNVWPGMPADHSINVDFWAEVPSLDDIKTEVSGNV